MQTATAHDYACAYTHASPPPDAIKISKAAVVQCGAGMHAGYVRATELRGIRASRRGNVAVAALEFRPRVGRRDGHMTPVGGVEVGEKDRITGRCVCVARFAFSMVI